MFSTKGLLVPFDFLQPTSGVLLIAKSLKKKKKASCYGQHKNLRSLKRGLVLDSISRVYRIPPSLGSQVQSHVKDRSV